MHVELVIAKIATVLLGTAISIQAMRGYRRHGSEPMLYLGAGFLIVTIGSVLEGVLFDGLGWSLFAAGAVQTSLVALGMLVILYSLFGEVSMS